MAQQNSTKDGPRAYAKVFDWKQSSSNVIIQHRHGAQIRANPTSHASVDHKGGQGDWSKWHIHIEDEHKSVQLQNYKTKKFFRISKDGKSFAVDDHGSKYSKFLLHFMSDESVQLESQCFPGTFIATKPHEGVVTAPKDEKNNTLVGYTYGVTAEEGLFMNEYLFKMKNTVIIRHPHEGGLAVIDGKLSDQGTKQQHSRWVATPIINEDKSLLVELQHEVTEQFLCISDDKTVELSKDASGFTKFKVHVISEPNIVKLESAEVPGAFVGVRREGVVVGKGGPHSQMTILRKT